MLFHFVDDGAPCSAPGCTPAAGTAQCCSTLLVRRLQGGCGAWGAGGGGRQAAGVQAYALTDSASSCRAWLCSILCTVLCRRPAAAFPARACAYACLVDGSCRARVAGPATALCSIHSLCARHEQLRIMATHLHSTAAALPSLARATRAAAAGRCCVLMLQHQLPCCVYSPFHPLWQKQRCRSGA